MKVLFSEAAASEYSEAVDFYAVESEELVRLFEREVGNAIKRMVRFPEGWAKESTGPLRKCLLNRFPYKMIYCVEEEGILVLAVAHQHRKPNYWQKR